VLLLLLIKGGLWFRSTPPALETPPVLEARKCSPRGVTDPRPEPECIEAAPGVPLDLLKLSAEKVDMFMLSNWNWNPRLGFGDSIAGGSGVAELNFSRPVSSKAF